MQPIFTLELPTNSKSQRVFHVRTSYKKTFIYLMDILCLSSDAGSAFTEAAKLHEERLDSRHEAANSYADAAQVYKKTSPQGTVCSTMDWICVYFCVMLELIDAVDCYRRSISIYSDMVSCHIEYKVFSIFVNS